MQQTQQDDVFLVQASQGTAAGAAAIAEKGWVLQGWQQHITVPSTPCYWAWIGCNFAGQQRHSAHVVRVLSSGDSTGGAEGLCTDRQHQHQLWQCSRSALAIVLCCSSRYELALFVLCGSWNDTKSDVAGLL